MTVSILREAEFLAEGAFSDFLRATAATADRLPRVKALQDRGARVVPVADDPSMVRLLGKAALVRSPAAEQAHEALEGRRSVGKPLMRIEAGSGSS